MKVLWRLVYGGAALGWALLVRDIVTAGMRGVPLDALQASLATIAAVVMAGNAAMRSIGKSDD